MSDGRDRIIERVRVTLREAPEVAPDPRAVARLLNVVWASPRPSLWRRLLDASRLPALSGLGATAVAAVALMVGFVTRGALLEPRTESPVAATPTGATAGADAGAGTAPLRLASAESGEAAAVLTQFVLDDASARRVSLVGDFNEWDRSRTPLTRLASGLWTASVPLVPGRHVYAFVVDDTLLVADPRAPKVSDADYGREGSVVMVFAR